MDLLIVFMQLIGPAAKLFHSPIAWSGENVFTVGGLTHAHYPVVVNLVKIMLELQEFDIEFFERLIFSGRKNKFMVARD